MITSNCHESVSRAEGDRKEVKIFDLQGTRNVASMVMTVVHYTDAETFGGAEQILLHTMEGLDRQRWRPVLFHHGNPGLKPLLARAQVACVPLRTVPDVQNMGDIGRLRQFIRALREEKASIFHAHLTWPLSCKYGLLAAALARVPVVVATTHTCQEFPKRQWLLRLQPRLLANGVDRYLAVSEAAAQILRDAFRIPAAKVQVVHNGIPLSSFERGHAVTPAAGLSLAVKRPIILAVGRLGPEKGHQHLLKAAALVPQATFALAGEGPMRQSLEAQAKQLGIDGRVKFLGHREDIQDLLATCDIFVLPSLSEGLPVSALEAMTASKPVIASAVGGNKEVVVHGETGLLVPPADPTALATAIQAILSDPAFAARLAVAGTARVQKQFSAETMVGRITQIYDELISVARSSIVAL
jgi:glycosyltransferase involved in cell wall biosynthesis